MKNNQGIAIVPIVVVIAAVLALGVTGYFFYSTIKNTNESTDANAGLVNVNTNSTAATNENTNVAVNTNTNTNTNSNVNTTADATKDWKTYTNTAYGYSVKYPPTYTLSGSDEAKKIDLADYPSGNVQHLAMYYSTGSNDAAFGVTGDGLAVIDWINNARAGFPDTKYLFNRRTTVIGGKTFITYDYDLGGSGGSVQYYLVQGNDVFIIHDWPGGAGNKNYNPLQAGRILPTFTFTSPTAGWKTYTNTKDGYSVKYPDDWIESESETGITISGTSVTKQPFSTPSMSIKKGNALYPKDTCLMQQTTVTVDGVNQTRQKEGCSYAGATVATFIKKGNEYIVVSWTEDVPAAFSTYDQILSTFTFTQH